MPILHTKVSTLSNNGDPNLVQPSDWNAAHTISGTLDLTQVSGIIGGLIPNSPLAFSATPVFNVAQNASYSMTLTGNVTSSTTTGTPQNGQLLSLTLTEDGVGGRTFAFPANFVLPPSFSFSTNASAINEVTFKFDGTNWHLISNSGGAGGGANPAGNQGDVQSKNGTALQASSINDNGTRVLLTNDAHFKGPNPYIDATAYGVRATTTSLPTTCTTTGGSANITIGAASTYVNGDGVVCRGAGATFSLSTPAAPTVKAVNANAPIGLANGAPNTSGATTYSYCVSAISVDGGFSPCSAVTTITNGPATLGAGTANISSWTRANNVVTVTTASAHNLVVNGSVTITSDPGIDGVHSVSTVPDNTHFTYQDNQDTRMGSAASGGNIGVITWYVGNLITIAPVTNAWAYLVYRTSGTPAFIGKTLPDPAFTGITGLTTDPLYNVVEDYGSTYTPAPTLPDWVPATAPGAAKNGDLVTTIVSGAGTTSLVVANNAINAVTGATFKLDNTPNIISAAAASVANGQAGVLFFPAAPSGLGSSAFYFTNSVLNLNTFFPRTLSIKQAGQIALGDTVILGNTTWKGDPQNTYSTTQFQYDSYPVITSTSAYPAIYNNTGVNNFASLAFYSLSNGVIFHTDQSSNGQIPWGGFDHCILGSAPSAGNDPYGRYIIIRGNIGGGAGFRLSYVNLFTNNPGVTPSSTPVMVQTRTSLSPFTFDHLQLDHRGIQLSVSTNGIQGKLDAVYCQGCTQPAISITNLLGALTPAVNLSLNNYIADTQSAPTFNYYGGLSGNLFMYGDTPVASSIPVVAGPGGLAIQRSAAVLGSQTGAGNLGQTQDVQNGPSMALAIDGKLNTGSALVANTQYNTFLSFGNPYKVFVNSLAPAAPTCAVSAGGAAPIQTSFFKFAPVYADGGEGTQSAASTSCTTTLGNQTTTISWTQVPNAIGYDLYVSSNGGLNYFSFQCAAPFVSPGSTVSYIWNTNTAVCGQSAPDIAGSGPTSLTAAGLNAPQLALEGGGSKSTFSGSFTATRTVTVPDITGTMAVLNASQALPATAGTVAILGASQTLPATAGAVVLSSGAMTNPTHLLITRTDGDIQDFAVAPMSVFDSFNRANGSISAGNPNWTVTNGTINIASNSIVGATGSGQNFATYTGVSFPSDDQTAAVTFTSCAPSVSTNAGIYVRGNATQQTGYAWFFHGNNNTLELYKINNGVFTQLGSDVAYTCTVGDIISVNANQTTITGYLNGVQKIQVTDATLTSGNPGVYFFTNAGNMTLTNFRASYGAVSLGVAQSWTAIQNFVAGAQLNGSTTLTSASGNSGRVGQTSGALTNGDIAAFDANGNIVDAGFAAGALPVRLSSIAAANAANSINNGDNAQTWNWALTTAAKTAFKFTENTAATSGAGSQFLGQFGTIAGSTAVPLNVFSSLTGSQTLPTLSITPTWNTTGVVDAALFVNATNTASGSGSLLADFQITGTSQWKLDKLGNTTQLGTVATGNTPPACTPGTAGGNCMQEGTSPSAGATYDTLYADSTQHAVSVNNNNTGNMPVSRLACVNVSPVTANTNTTNDQNLMSCTLNANLLNVVGRTLKVWTASLYSTPAASVATITTKIKLCTVSGCGSGTVIALATYGSSANPGSVTNNQVNTSTYVSTQTAGASSVQESHGNMVIDLGASPTVADSTFADTNTATSGAIDSTAQLFLQITGTFSVASASNSMTQRQLVVEVIN